MKKIIIFLIIFFPKDIVAQEIIIKDSLFDIAIENVNLSQNNYGETTDKNGRVDISKFNEHDSIIVSHLSYQSKKIKKKDVSNILLLIPRIKILPTVLLNENSKTLLSKKYHVFKITPLDAIIPSISSSDLLASNSSVVIQESQSGGGSPNYRGMEASRLLLIIDGIPLNNAIYRSGHLQASGTINPFFIEAVSLLSGPASVAYGNGAMGGALLFETKKNTENKNQIILHQQYESANNSVSLNLLSSYTKNRTSYLTGGSIKTTGNLKMGNNRQHGYENWGNESIVTNGPEQFFTAYQQFDFLHKTNYQINQTNQLSFNTQYSTSSNINRFDKLNDYKEGLPKYNKWYYGPQNRLLQTVCFSNNQPKVLFDKFKTTLAYQNIQESRHKQKLTDELLNNRTENLHIYDVLVDFKKQLFDTKITYGVGVRSQSIYSVANLSNQAGNKFYNTTRYPDGGSMVQDYFSYGQIVFPIVKKIDLVIGGRWNKNYLTAAYKDTATYQLPFSTIKNKNQSFISSVLLTYKITNKTTLNTSYYKGFRNPNVDDIAKIFSKNNGYVVVPNPELEPEYSDNFEISINYNLKNSLFQLEFFNTNITNAIYRDIASISGEDSLIYDEEMMRIQTNKNIASANIKGVSFNSNYRINNLFSINASCNYLTGLTNENLPLAHIPPLNAKFELIHLINTHSFSFYTYYSAAKKAVEYDVGGVDNLEEATINGTPMWYTLNLAYKNNFDKNLSFSFGIKNILDIHYKMFGSGLSASGRNFIVSLSFNL